MHHPTGALISLEAALATLLSGVVPVPPRSEPLDRALGRVAAAMPASLPALPLRDISTIDGWACRSLDLVGASPYSPLALSTPPVPVEVGDVMPTGSDCVLQADLVDCSSPIAFAVGEAAPGQGVRRVGEDMTAHRPPVLEGGIIGAADLLIARKAGLSQIPVRSPRVRVIDVASVNHETFSTHLVAECVMTSNGTIAAIETANRDAASIAAALAGEACDLLLLIGGTGAGRLDATAEALTLSGASIAHGIAVRPGDTTAIGWLGSTPLVALAGAPDHVFAGFLAFVQPVLDRLSGRSKRIGTTLPLSRKIASMVGFNEIVLLGREQAMWTPLAVGNFSLEAMRLADAWLAVPGDSEGYDVGTPVTAMPLRNSN
ncbi:molybdopterin-binding protein [Sinorhizobium medicae]|uniref:molybdopterin-binding protein n=1 Tax=Sinorhizobium medicae TaxID=110321 RepID=UPI00042586A2